MDLRATFHYPPSTHLVLITVRCPHQERGSFSTVTLGRRLAEDLPAGAVLSDPVPAPLEKLKGQYRFQLLLRGRSALRLSRHVRAVTSKLQMPGDVTTTVDVDPYQLL
jgi:primosomal protein N' (replication factor Y)